MQVQKYKQGNELFCLLCKETVLLFEENNSHSFHFLMLKREKKSFSLDFQLPHMLICSQNHRITVVGIGRDLKRSSTPTP